MKRLIIVLVLIAMLFPVAVGMVPTQAANGDPVINEIRIDQPSADNDEYFELAGGASISLDGLTYLVIGDGTGGSGVIEAVVELTGQTIPGSGYFVAAESTFTLGTADLTTSLNFENSDNVTHLLVSGFTGANGDDLDTDDDGVLDSTPWSTLVDCVALIETVGSGDQVYCSTTVGPDETFVPGHALLCDDGWQIGQFDPSGGDDTPGTANNCAPPPLVVTIMEIQGSGQLSPYDGETVETTGVVTLFTADGAHCWLQDADGDGDAATSDGIFVSGCAYPDEGPIPAVGDLIRIIASVEEQQFGNALPLTRLRSVALIEVHSSDNPLPTPIELSDLPDESIPEGIAFWEPLEGMLVSVQNAPVVAATSDYGEFAMLTKDDAKPGSGFYPQTQQLFIRNLGDDLVDYNPERILVDDSTLDDPIVVMPGDRVRSLVGALDYTFGNYKIQPASFDVKTHNLPNLPASTRSGGFGNVTITTFNVENLFDLVLNTPQNVDVFGQVGFDPGSQWGPPNTQNNTLGRKPGVCQGDADAADTFDPSVEWEGFGNNNFADLGSHTVTCGPTDDLIISEYVEGSSNNKALEIYNGTGAAVDLAAGNYSILMSFNGGTSTYTIDLTGTVADGDVYVVAPTNATDAKILTEADQLQGTSWFNGDDAVVLRKAGKDDSSSTPTPEELETQLTKLALAIQVELELPEIIVVQEVENTAILQELGDWVNTTAGTNYVATSFETSDARGIEVGFLYDDDPVDLLEAFQLSGPDVEAAFGPSSASPGREPLYGKFMIADKMVHIVGNHFKSKGGDDPLFGMDWPPIRITEVQRKMQAQVVRDFVNTILDVDANALVMVTGDLNDFQFGEPDEGAEHPIAILEGVGGGVPLTNLLNLEKDAETYTYVYDGNSQVLDHMLVSPALLDRFAAVDVLHFNAGYPDSLGADPSTPLRASDHDALEGRFRFK